MPRDAFETVVRTEDQLPEVAAGLLQFAGSTRVFLMNGDMGAGKTSLIKALCRQLGSEDHFSSPTFSIVNEYQAPAGKIYHLDLYRLRQPEELFDIGFEEIVDSGLYCFIEWPDLATELIEDKFITVTITVTDGVREIKAV